MDLLRGRQAHRPKRSKRAWPTLLASTTGATPSSATAARQNITLVILRGAFGTMRAPEPPDQLRLCQNVPFHERFQLRACRVGVCILELRHIESVEREHVVVRRIADRRTGAAVARALEIRLRLQRVPGQFFTRARTRVLSEPMGFSRDG